MYASSAWWGFAGASDCQRLAAFIRRSDRSRFVPANLPTFADLRHDADEKMFAAITSDRHDVLHDLLPPQSTGSQNYNLRQRTHNFALPSRSGHLTDNNLIQRMLYFDVYQDFNYVFELINSTLFIFLVCSRVAFRQPSIKPRLRLRMPLMLQF